LAQKQVWRSPERHGAVSDITKAQINWMWPGPRERKRLLAGQAEPATQIVRIGTTFSDDRFLPAEIEGGVLEMADDVWTGCEKNHSLTFVPSQD
jgi:hypothetical protein